MKGTSQKNTIYKKTINTIDTNKLGKFLHDSGKVTENLRMLKQKKDLRLKKMNTNGSSIYNHRKNSLLIFNENRNPEDVIGSIYTKQEDKIQREMKFEQIIKEVVSKPDIYQRLLKNLKFNFTLQDFVNYYLKGAFQEIIKETETDTDMKEIPSFFLHKIKDLWISGVRRPNNLTSIFQKQFVDNVRNVQRQVPCNRSITPNLDKLKEEMFNAQKFQTYEGEAKSSGQYSQQFLKKKVKSSTWLEKYFCEKYNEELVIQNGRAQTTQPRSRQYRTISQQSEQVKQPLQKEIFSQVSPKTKIYQKKYLDKIINQCERQKKETNDILKQSKQKQFLQNKYISKWQQQLQMAQDLSFVPIHILTSIIQHLHYVNDTYKIESFLASSEWKEGQFDSSKNCLLYKTKRKTKINSLNQN